MNEHCFSWHNISSCDVLCLRHKTYASWLRSSSLFEVIVGKMFILLCAQKYNFSIRLQPYFEIFPLPLISNVGFLKIILLFFLAYLFYTHSKTSCLLGYLVTCSQGLHQHLLFSPLGGNWVNLFLHSPHSTPQSPSPPLSPVPACSGEQVLSSTLPPFPTPLDPNNPLTLPLNKLLE